MEVAGLVIGAAGLAGLFSCCSSAFQLVQRGRAFGQDYKILETKLSNQELRLRAWGRACGLIDGVPYDPRLDEPELQCQLVKTLECIKQLLSDAQTLQDRYGVAQSTFIPSTTNSLGRLERRRSLNRLLKRRSKAQPSVPNHVATALWVIDDREKFSELIKHLKDFIDDLESLTRATQVPHRQLIFIDYEIECISDIEVLEDIQAAREGDDDAVSDAASVRLEQISQGTASIRSSLTSTNAGSFLTLESYFTARSRFSDVPSSRFSMASIPDSDYVSRFSWGPGSEDVESLPAGKRLSRRLSMLEVPVEAKAKLKQYYKCVVVGEACARKTELLSLFTRGHLPDEYAPIIFDERVTEIQVEDQQTGLILSDITGIEEYPSFAGRMLSGADIVIICFLVDSVFKDSNVSKWRPIVAEYCPRAHCILAGIMRDGNHLTSDTADTDMDPKPGRTLATKNDIPNYVQCCLEKGPGKGGVDDLFEVVCTVSLARTLV
ncbi:prion-inhibition and propagation-domain-containing protein [Clohesyomyces aquaticus]|uniref:Prion-inhibition and propagation-domain-containing protein n=1 Tax=Clohesyomyces aquaticus TaxID=1231657 RepID=A0A1Y1YKR9_9PLEO|nr:prion-inhibition and propagation-domain-containing protein [Clohesyomyces aquaticus]